MSTSPTGRATRKEPKSIIDKDFQFAIDNDDIEAPVKEPKFEFLEDGHLYMLDGVNIPSVSEIIHPCTDYDHVPQGNLEDAREFGIAVDLACQYCDEGDLDVNDLDSRVGDRLEGWVKFLNDFEFKPIQIARPAYHVINGMSYGMTADRFGTSKIGNLVVDIKNTAEIEPHQALQLAGYHAHYSENGKHDVKRVIVQLKDGDYNTVIEGQRKDIFDRNDIKVFQALLAICHWNRLKGIKKKWNSNKQ